MIDATHLEPGWRFQFRRHGRHGGSFEPTIKCGENGGENGGEWVNKSVNLAVASSPCVP